MQSLIELGFKCCMVSGDYLYNIECSIWLLEEISILSFENSHPSAAMPPSRQCQIAGKGTEKSTQFNILNNILCIIAAKLLWDLGAVNMYFMHPAQMGEHKRVWIIFHHLKFVPAIILFTPVNSLPPYQKTWESTYNSAGLWPLWFLPQWPVTTASTAWCSSVNAGKKWNDVYFKSWMASISRHS